eukprot:358532-Chlamydomonas_euryale.AAC.2
MNKRKRTQSNLSCELQIKPKHFIKSPSIPLLSATEPGQANGIRVRLLHASVLGGVPVANTHAGVAHAVEFGLQEVSKRLVGRMLGQVIRGGPNPARRADALAIASLAICRAVCVQVVVIS